MLHERICAYIAKFPDLLPFVLL